MQPKRPSPESRIPRVPRSKAGWLPNCQTNGGGPCTPSAAPLNHRAINPESAEVELNWVDGDDGMGVEKIGFCMMGVVMGFSFGCRFGDGDFDDGDGKEIEELTLHERVGVVRRPSLPPHEVPK